MMMMMVVVMMMMVVVTVFLSLSLSRTVGSARRTFPACNENVSETWRNPKQSGLQPNYRVVGLLYIYIFSSSLMPLNGNDLFRLVNIYKTPSVCFSFDSRLRDILPESLDFTITKSVCFNNRTSNDSFK
jgi:hypothetical protein